MTWIEQVGHVMFKDLREFRMLLAIYGAVVVMATRNALYIVADRGHVPGLMLLVVILGVAVVATLVQADSPTKTDAFWAGRPFYSSAVLAAKFALTITVVLGLAAVGQFVAIQTIHLAGRAIPQLLLAAVWAYAVWLVTAMVLAALTKDLRSFIVAFIVIYLASSFIPALFMPAHSPTPLPIQTAKALTLVGALGGMTLLLLLYRRGTGRLGFAAGIAAAACVFVPMILPLSTNATTLHAAALDAAVVRANFQPATLKVSLDTERAPVDVQVVLRVEGGEASERFTADIHSAKVYLRIGSTIVLPIPDSTFVKLYANPPASGVHWGGRHFDASPGYAPAQLGVQQQRAIAQGIDSITVEGSLAVEDLRILGSLPLQAHATFAGGGWAMQLAKVDRVKEGVAVQVVGRSVETNNHQLTTSNPLAPDLALVNEALGQAVWLGGSGGRSWETLVLPGNTLETTTLTLRMDPPQSWEHMFRIDDTWILGARLIVTQWQPLGSYPVHASLVVPR